MARVSKGYLKNYTVSNMFQDFNCPACKSIDRRGSHWETSCNNCTLSISVNPADDIVIGFRNNWEDVPYENSDNFINEYVQKIKLIILCESL